MDCHSCIAIIPARGGSKGIPRKNLQQIGGVSLIGRAIGACAAAAYVSVVYVSTEDEEIAEESVRHGAIVVRRPRGLATDDAGSAGVLLHALDLMPACEILAFVQCTAPFMTPDDIDGTIARLVTTDADVAIAAAPTDAIQVEEGFRSRVHGVGWDLLHGRQRRQERPQRYEIAGSVWVMWSDRFRRRGTIYSHDTTIYKVRRRFEIDTPEELEQARLTVNQGIYRG